MNINPELKSFFYHNSFSDEDLEVLAMAIKWSVVALRNQYSSETMRNAAYVVERFYMEGFRPI